jgi:YD repeat-containing protein
MSICGQFQHATDAGNVNDSFTGRNGMLKITRKAAITSQPTKSGYSTWTYNALGQVTSGDQNIDNATCNSSGTYDAFGRPLTQVLPSTETLNYTYNAMGALSSLGGTLNGTTPYVSQIHYNASGQ